VIEFSERRPIAARRWRVSNAAAAFLARRGVSANAISVAGMGFAIAAGLLLAMTSWMPPVARLLWLFAAIGIQARLIANMLDGMVALATGTASRGCLVAGTGVPVVPCHIAGAFAALPPHRRLPRPARLTLTIGTPLTFGEVSDDKVGWLQIAATAEKAVRRLAGPERGDVC
jgi:hypothetical protein